MPTYQLTSDIYLDKMNKCYKKIITINKPPSDPSFNKLIATVRREKLSIFQGYGNSCDCKKPCLLVVLNIMFGSTPAHHSKVDMYPPNTSHEKGWSAGGKSRGSDKCAKSAQGLT